MAYAGIGADGIGRYPHDTAAAVYFCTLGVQGMADRPATLGGALQVRSQPGHGTTATGQFLFPRPVRAEGADALSAGPARTQSKP